LLNDIDGVRPFTEGATSRGGLTGEQTSVREPNEAARRAALQVHAPEYFTGRKGYDPLFLGTDVALPTLTANALRFGKVAPVIGNANNELAYTHFSIVMNATRRLAFVTAVNIDGAQSEKFGVNRHPWFFDGRLDLTLQVDDTFYGNEPTNFFDRGHLVRRLDPVWGDSATLEIANGDTFHWTNCSPQQKDFNQSQALWQGLENFILNNTNTDNLRTSVFTGPVFHVNDPWHRNVQIPQSFWKVVVVVDVNGKMYSSAYEVSQQQLVQDIGFERLPVGKYSTFQISIAELEQKTGLQFGANVRDSDVLQGGVGRELQEFAHIQLPSKPNGFGRFANAGEFLASYTAAHLATEQTAISGLSLEKQLERSRKQRDRNVVEIEATVVENQGVVGGGQGKHQHMILQVLQVLQDDPDVENDVQRVLAAQEHIFLAIRVGDSMGLARPVPNVHVGDKLKMRGEWITKDKAYSHGGEKMSVLHFTHHPLGFVCNVETCYQ
jgi:endonuclease G